MSFFFITFHIFASHLDKIKQEMFVNQNIYHILNSGSKKIKIKKMYFQVYIENSTQGVFQLSLLILHSLCYRQIQSV